MNSKLPSKSNSFVFLSFLQLGVMLLQPKQSQFGSIHVRPNWLRSRRTANTLSKMWLQSCQWKISLQSKWPNIIVNVNVGVDTACSHTIILRVLGMKGTEWQRNWEVVCLSDLRSTKWISVFGNGGPHVSCNFCLALDLPSTMHSSHKAWINFQISQKDSP
jgi:hypothetical protein